MSPRIDRPAPPYMQITDGYRQQIHDGTLAEGAKLPTVAEIAQIWSVAHATAAKAIGQLQVEGLIITSPRGSFVAGKASKATSPHDRFMRFRRSGTLSARDEYHRVMAAELVEAPTYVAELLGLDEPNAQVIRREFVTGEGSTKSVRSLTVTWYPATLAEAVPELLATETSKASAILGKVEEVSGKVTLARDFYHARGADQREANMLGLPVGSAILAGAWLAWSCVEGEDRLVEYGEICLPPRHTVSYPYEVPETPEKEEVAA